MPTIPFTQYTDGQILEPEELNQITGTLGNQLPAATRVTLGDGVITGLTLSAGSSVLAAGEAVLGGCILKSDSGVQITGVTPSATNYIFVKLKGGTGVSESWSAMTFDAVARTTPGEQDDLYVGSAAFGSDSLVSGSISTSGVTYIVPVQGELLAARGSASTLADRLSGSLEDDGTLKADTVTSTQIASSAVTNDKLDSDLDTHARETEHFANFVASGLAVTYPATGFGITIAQGVAYISGWRVALSQTSFTATPTGDGYGYLDLFDDGTMIMTYTDYVAPAPAVASNATRLWRGVMDTASGLIPMGWDLRKLCGSRNAFCRTITANPTSTATYGYTGEIVYESTSSRWFGKKGDPGTDTNWSALN